MSEQAEQTKPTEVYRLPDHADGIAVKVSKRTYALLVALSQIRNGRVTEIIVVKGEVDTIKGSFEQRINLNNKEELEHLLSGQGVQVDMRPE